MAPCSRRGYGHDHRLPPGQVPLSSLAREEGVSVAARRSPDRTETRSDRPNGDCLWQMEAGRGKTGTVSTRGGHADFVHRVGRTRPSVRAENAALPEQMNAPHGKGPAVLTGLGPCELRGKSP